MSKLKKLVMCVLAVCSVSCLSFAAAACDKNSDYPNYKNPTVTDNPDDNPDPDAPNTDPDAPYSGIYYINVKSVGGLPLNGVRIAAKKNGITQLEGISSDGIITFGLEQGEYELEIIESSLPDGYYIPDNETFKTSADLANAYINLPSTIISSTASSSKRYSIGDVMYNFSFTEVSNKTTYTLSEIFSTKKAVILNFFYTTCGPCKSEFPALQAAYDNFSDDVAVIALADTSMDSNFDTVAKFKENMELDFYMGQDMAQIGNLFSVESYPTTVVIDRYGVISEIHKGSIPYQSVWTSMFSTYSSDDYVQSGNAQGPEEGGNSQELVKPDVEMSSPAAIASAINGSGTEGKVGLYYTEPNPEDAVYSWPWRVGTDADGSCISASNASVGNSYANIYTTLTLKTGDILSYEYNVVTESGADVLYVLIDREIIAEHSGDSDGWQTNQAVYIAQRDITVTFAMSYLKDEAAEPENERASIRNITIVNADSYEIPLDVYTSAVSGEVKNGKYESYLDNLVLSSVDNYYHVGGEDGPILFADILETSAWSDLHCEGKYFTNDEGTTTKASLYLISFWTMSNYKQASETVPLKFTYDSANSSTHTDTIIDNYYWQGFSKNRFVPVTEKLKQAIIAFTKQYCTENDKSYYEEQWLEMCYYGKHYGPKHIADEECEIYIDPVKALDFSNAYEINVNETTHVDIDIILKWNNGGGKFYKFVPETTGIYYFYSDFGKWESDPYVIVYNNKPDERTGSEHTVIAEFNDDMSPTTITNLYRYNFYGYAYMEAGETYYFQCRCWVPGTIGEYDFKIEFTGENELDVLKICTTGDGLWSFDETTYETYYLAIDVALNDGVYYEVTTDGGYGSEIYIDFLNPNYYDNNNHNVKWMIENGYFNLGEYGDFTARMNEFYQASIAGKTEDDELYGMHLATEELVGILGKYFDYAHGESKVSGYWLSLAVYFEHYGA